MRLADALAHADQQPVTTRCLFCDWTLEGINETNRVEAVRHQQEAHGIFAKKRRKQGAKSPWRSDKALDDNIAEARKMGAATWAKP